MIEQTNTKPQEILELKMNKQMELCLFNPSIILSEQGKWMSAVTNFEVTNSVFNIAKENNSFSITIQVY